MFTPSVQVWNIFCILSVLLSQVAGEIASVAKIEPRSQKVYLHGAVNLTCIPPSGYEVDEYSFLHNSFSERTQQPWTIINITNLDQAGEYFCAFFNRQLNLWSNYQQSGYGSVVQIIVPITFLSPMINESINLYAMNDFKLECFAFADRKIDIVWLKDFKPVDTSQFSMYTFEEHVDGNVTYGITTVTKGLLRLSKDENPCSNEARLAGDYQCVAMFVDKRLDDEDSNKTSAIVHVDVSQPNSKDPIVITTSPNDINVILKCPFTECNVTWSRSPSVRSVAMETTCNQLIISKVTYEHFGKYTCHRRRWLGNCITFRTYTFNLMQAPRTTTAAFIIRSAASAASTKPTSLQSTSSKLMAASSINTLSNSVDNEPTSVHSDEKVGKPFVKQVLADNVIRLPRSYFIIGGVGFILLVVVFVISVICCFCCKRRAELPRVPDKKIVRTNRVLYQHLQSDLEFVNATYCNGKLILVPNEVYECYTDAYDGEETNSSSASTTSTIVHPKKCPTEPSVQYISVNGVQVNTGTRP